MEGFAEIAVRMRFAEVVERVRVMKRFGVRKESLSEGFAEDEEDSEVEGVMVPESEWS